MIKNDCNHMKNKGLKSYFGENFGKYYFATPN